MKKTVSLLCLIMTAVFFLCGCRLIRIEKEERKPLEYTVVNPQDIPGEILDLVEEKKNSEFQMTYQNGEELYLVKGYGQQMSGGYSIQVEELSLSDTAVFFKTKLLGPPDDSQCGEPSYPYIVVKMQYRKEPVQFQ